ncbi:hypothetical protein NAP1_02635 [Erythrobacter sp. NAP1]|nr:hypothetical protein NAP1_02635 [Erythrobacter sp. NAP1]
MTALAAITLVLGTAACSGGAESDTAEATAATGIVGTWTVNLDSAEWENANSNYAIADGEYTCNSCLPPYSVAADGNWQSVDRPGLDQVMITVVDDNTVELASRFEGEDQGKSVWTVGEDGQTMTINWTNYEDAGETTGTSMMTRVEAGPDGSHAASGEWAPAGVSEMSDEARSVTITEDGDTITFASFGGGYTATLGGDAVTIDGDNSGTMVAIEKTGDNTYRETFTRDGETTGVNDWTVDGDTLTVVATDPRDDSKVSWTATRQ